MIYRLLFLLSISTLCLSNTLAQSKKKVNYKYLLYVPKDYNENKKDYPLVIYLHGRSRRGNDLNMLKKYGPPFLVKKGYDFDFIIASPQCPATKYWSSENWFEPLYSELKNKYQVDTNKVYLTGMSMGGYGVFSTALEYPETFAALIALCGGCMNSDLKRICTLKHIPIWAFHGAKDELVPFSESKKIADALKKCDGNMKLTKMPNAGHAIHEVYEDNTELYKWMLKQQRGKIKQH